MEAQQLASKDAQLDAANTLLHWLRHSPQARKAGARVHPMLHAARDQYGGLCLKVGHLPSHPGSQTCTSYPQCIARTKESKGGRRTATKRKKDGRSRSRQEGIAADEELLAIPRSLMLEPASLELLIPALPAGAPPAPDSQSSLLPAHLPESMPQASLALALLQLYRRQQQQQQQNQQNQQQEHEQQQQQQQQHQEPHQHHQQEQPEQQQKHQHKDKGCSSAVPWHAPEEAQCCAQEQSACLPAAYFECLPSEADLSGILPVLAHFRQQQQHEQRQAGGRQAHLQHQIQPPILRTHEQVAPDGSTRKPPSLIAAALASSPTASAALATQVERLEEEWQALQAPPFLQLMLQLGLVQPGLESTPAGGQSNLSGTTQAGPLGKPSNSCVSTARVEKPLLLRGGVEGMQHEGTLPGGSGSEGARPCRIVGDSSSCAQIRGPLPSQYLWARGLVWSRAIHLWSGPTFVPAIDLLNHAYPPNVRCMVRSEDDVGGADSTISDEGSCSEDDSSSDANSTSSTSNSSSCSSVPLGIVTRYTRAKQREMFVCQAIHPLPLGTQALWHYNSHSLDAGWLLCYGFVPEDRSSRPDRSGTGPEELDLAIKQLDMNTLSGTDSQQPADMEVDPGMFAAVRSLLVREREAKIDSQRTSHFPELLPKDTKLKSLKGDA